MFGIVHHPRVGSLRVIMWNAQKGNQPSRDGPSDVFCPVITAINNQPVDQNSPTTANAPYFDLIKTTATR